SSTPRRSTSSPSRTSSPEPSEAWCSRSSSSCWRRRRRPSPSPSCSPSSATSDRSTRTTCRRCESDVDARWLFLIPLLPLCGAVVNGVAGAALQRRFGRRAITVVAVGVMLAAVALAIGAVAKLAALPVGEHLLTDRVFTMLQVGGLQVDFTLALDALSAVLV